LTNLISLAQHPVAIISTTIFQISFVVQLTTSGWFKKTFAQLES